ncbi:hypothetical protein F511_17045 [Dorcoceras hygrometricum]|uniref:Uncharacterized protein n=1 Tax=Dorcoceras hygrometricum TaxID=472368 RepID=A0A2Z7BGQ3_9LAMI|nr:hypothetical protein F511_17045 [Dorcoceras hygrometricum]
MIEQQAQEHVEELSPVVENVEEAEDVDSVERQAQEEKCQAFEAEQPVEHRLKLKVVESLESKVDMVRDDQTYMKHEFNIFRRAFYKKMDEVVTSVNTSQTALETNLVRQFTESQ